MKRSVARGFCPAFMFFALSAFTGMPAWSQVTDSTDYASIPPGDLDDRSREYAIRKFQWETTKLRQLAEYLEKEISRQSNEWDATAARIAEREADIPSWIRHADDAGRSAIANRLVNQMLDASLERAVIKSQIEALQSSLTDTGKEAEDPRIAILESRREAAALKAKIAMEEGERVTRLVKEGQAGESDRIRAMSAVQLAEAELRIADAELEAARVPARADETHARIAELSLQAAGHDIRVDLTEHLLKELETAQKIRLETDALRNRLLQIGESRKQMTGELERIRIEALRYDILMDLYKE